MTTTLPGGSLPRRILLRGLLAVAAVIGATPAAAARPAPANGSRRLLLKESYVAGTAYYQAAAVMADLRPGERLILRRQPGNPYDGNAIEVFTAAAVKLGYVPRIDNEPFARLMDAGREIEADVACISSRQYEPIGLQLYLAEA